MSTFYDEGPQRKYGLLQSHMGREWPRPNSVCFFGSETCTLNHNTKLPPIAKALKEHIGPQREVVKECFPEEIKDGFGGSCQHCIVEDSLGIDREGQTPK